MAKTQTPLQKLAQGLVSGLLGGAQPNEGTRYEQRADELGCKLAAKLLLSKARRPDHRGLYLPTYEEWVGINLLERDDELP